MCGFRCVEEQRRDDFRHNTHKSGSHLTGVEGLTYNVNSPGHLLYPCPIRRLSTFYLSGYKIVSIRVSVLVFGFNLLIGRNTRLTFALIDFRIIDVVAFFGELLYYALLVDPC